MFVATRASRPYHKQIIQLGFGAPVPRYMAKILVLNNWSVYPPKSGGQQAVYQLCSGLATRHHCTYAYLSEWTALEVHSTLAPRFQSIELPALHHKTAASRLRAPGFLYGDRLIKFSMRAGGSSDLRSSLRRLIATHDVVMFSHPWAWMATKGIPELRHKLVIYDSHNVELELARQAPAPYLDKLVNVRAVTKIERELCRRADLILTCTMEDRDQYMKEFDLPQGKFHVGFKGVHCAVHAAGGVHQPSQRRAAALFVGSEWLPNNMAAEAINTQIAPALRDLEFIVAGTCSRHVPEPIADNVSLMGFVDDLPALMQDVLVAINPITAGSGINMKMMEYLAAGLPIVTTPFGARGITGDAREALVICEMAEFPGAIRALTQDPQRWQRLSAIARRTALQQYDWPRISQRLSDLITAGLSLRRQARGDNLVKSLATASRT